MAVDIAALNQLHRLALDHLAYCCSLAVYGVAAAAAAAAAVADVFPTLDRVEYFEAVFVDFGTTSEINQHGSVRKIQMNEAS